MKQLPQVQRGRSTSQGNEPHQLQILYWMVASSTKGNFYVIFKQTVVKVGILWSQIDNHTNF